ncbi:MAG: hypothetical protein K0R62_4954 [Nonomuraea muscovyensis]|jgi:hypothetical protein|nr:hypothetical protein [Nonomuraea muscovyensis]
MERREITQRVVGILTQTTEVKRLVMENPDREDDQLNAAAAVVGDLVSEVLRTEVSLPGDASPQEVAAVVAEACGPAVHQLLAAFAYAFTELAEVHDAGRTDVTSTEVLRELALRAERY